MADEPVDKKKKGATLTKWMSMKFSKASTQGGQSAVDEEINKRQSLHINSPAAIPGLSADGSATFSGGKADKKKKPGLAEIFGSPDKKPNGTPEEGAAFPGINVRGEDDAEMKLRLAKNTVSQSARPASSAPQPPAPRTGSNITPPQPPKLTAVEQMAAKDRAQDEQKIKELEERQRQENARKDLLMQPGYRGSDPNVFGKALTPEELAILKAKSLEEREAELARREQQLALMQTNSQKLNQLDKLDNILVKLDRLDRLDKLDKLDALFAKLNNIGPGSFSGGGGGGQPAAGARTLDDIKKDIEGLQKIIFNSASSEKEIADANIKLEKVMVEYDTHPDARAEAMKAKEERRKKHEPLNKAALVKMKEQYQPDAVKKNPALLTRVTENPELRLLFMDPEQILKLHQNDFKSFTLRNCTLEEIRAIRACMPNFRRDQKLQLDWVEGMDDKIEQQANEKPKEPKPAALNRAVSWKPPAAVKGGPSPGGLFAELLAKRGATTDDIPTGGGGGAGGPPPPPVSVTKAKPALPPKMPPLPPKQPTSAPTLAPTLAPPVAPNSRASTGGSLPSLAPPAPPAGRASAPGVVVAPTGPPSGLPPVLERLKEVASKLENVNRPEQEIAKDTRAVVQEIKMYTQLLNAANWKPEMASQMENVASQIVYAIKAVLVAKKTNGDIGKAQADLNKLLDQIKTLVSQST